MRPLILMLLLTMPAFGADPVAKAKALAAMNFAAAAESLCGGLCEDDLDYCRTKALADGKPLVLFVGPKGCQGAAKKLTGVIPCRVDEYHGDGHPDGPATPRVVILKRGDGTTAHGPDPRKLYVRGQLPSGCQSTEIQTAVDGLTPKPATALPTALPKPATALAPADWFVIGPPVIVQPVAFPANVVAPSYPRPMSVVRPSVVVSAPVPAVCRT
jgi:hypothetical protein